tara:strand:+ start:149 stop:700 length:552 start_codon:yes stop_codon:yes gene_type:complete
MKNQEQIAIEELAILIVENKKGIIDLINAQGLGSLTYNSSLREINIIVLDNLKNTKFVKGLESVVGDEYKYEPLTTATIIIIAIIASSTVYKIGWSIKDAEKKRKALVKQGYRALYLKRKELQEIALLNREKMQNMIIQAQADYMQQRENYDAFVQQQKKQNVLIMIVASVIVVALTGRFLLD